MSVGMLGGTRRRTRVWAWACLMGREEGHGYERSHVQTLFYIVVRQISLLFCLFCPMPIKFFSLSKDLLTPGKVSSITTWQMPYRVRVGTHADTRASAWVRQPPRRKIKHRKASAALHKWRLIHHQTRLQGERQDERAHECDQRNMANERGNQYRHDSL